MSALVVGSPEAAMPTCAELGMPGTLVWDSADHLRDSADALGALGWDALLVDPDDEAFSTASMAFRSQVQGPVPGMIVHAGEPADGASLDHLLRVAVMVARHLPPLPVVITGPAATEFAALWEEPRGDLELEPPLVGLPLADAWAECEAIAAAAPPPEPSHTHHH